MGCDCVACVAAEPAPSSGNSVGDAGAAAFAAALEKNSSLRTLDFDCEAFDFLCCLQRLDDFDFCCFGVL